MKIYYAASISGGRENVEIYHEIIQYLDNFGTVLTEHIGDKNLGIKGENLSSRKIHDRDWGWVLESDVIIAEVTNPSLGVGYELGRAVEKEKDILCLYNPAKVERLSAMIAGCPDLKVVKYEIISEAKKHLDKFFKNKKDDKTAS